MDRCFILYDEKFKKNLVSRVEAGEIRLNDAARKYGIGGHSTISRWVTKYGKLGGLIKKQIKMKKKRIAETPEERIQELESELYLYKKLIEVSKYFRDPAVKKKIVEGLSAHYGKSKEDIIQMGIPLLKSVRYSESVDKDIISTNAEQNGEQNRRND